VPLADAEAVADAPADELLALDAALERLAAIDATEVRLTIFFVATPECTIE
jgi:hypothetical protein